jgi:hypothetical protein
MTDIDFDELDRAVNSLMSKQQEKNSVDAEVKHEVETPSVEEKKTIETSTVGSSFAPPVTPFAPALDAPSPSSTTSASSVESKAELQAPQDSLVEKPEIISAPAATVAPSIALDQTPDLAPKENKTSPVITRRPTGRFMDVVRPSSVNNIQKSASSAPSRTGISIQPLADLVDVVNMTGKTSPIEEELSAVDNQLDSLDDAPDLKDIQNESAFAAIEDAPVEELSLTDKIAQSLSESNDSIASPAPEPLESPFIANVEVEKRPLGVVDQNAIESESDVEEDEFESGSADLEDMKLNHQYNADLSNYTMDKEALSEAPDSMMDLSPEIIAIEEAGIPGASEINEVADSEPNMQPSSPASQSNDTPQQYSSENEMVDSEPAPMFAAVSTEVKPPRSEEKKKTGLLTLLLIILFLVVGVAGGAVSYFLLIK